MFNSIDEAISDILEQKIIIVVDDENRENEGDFIFPAQTITAKHVNFMALHGRGLICAPVSQDYARRLNLTPMVEKNEDCLETAFTVSVDAKSGISTGISAQDRAITLNLLGSSSSVESDFVKPGHIFPLTAKPNGVVERPGHTEAAVDLAVLSGHTPAGVICEILNSDGSCARVPDLLKLAGQFDLKIITIEDLIKYKNKGKGIK